MIQWTQGSEVMRRLGRLWITLFALVEIGSLMHLWLRAGPPPALRHRRIRGLVMAQSRQASSQHNGFVS
jgi:hypothetical protein